MNLSCFHQWVREKKTDTLVMGILNITPDSFSDGGKYELVDKAVQFALQMEDEGADIIDIGGESTRPGANSVSVLEECSRVLPIIEGLKAKSEVLISIDTYKSDVARQSIKAGAEMVNDISGMTFDSNMAKIISESKLPVVLMHIKGTPKNMQENPNYDDLIKEVSDYLRDRVKFAKENGVKEWQIILDPGIGFGKRVEDNFQLLRELNVIEELGFPVLVGPSRKSFIGLTLNLPVDKRMEGTAAAVTAGILNGARIVRVHDVKEMKRVVKITDEIRGYA